MQTLFSFYRDKSWAKFKSLSTREQISKASKSSLRTAVMDFCGMSCKCFGLLPKNCDVFIMESEDERIPNWDDYDLVITILYFGQNVLIEFPSIEIVYMRNEIQR